MTLKEANLKAVGGGYEGLSVRDIEVENYNPYNGPQYLDPLFWQGLGEILGWYDDAELIPNSWLYYAHRFFSHVMEGGDAESFFATL